jgi:hypothetical protein
MSKKEDVPAEYDSGQLGNYGDASLFESGETYTLEHVKIEAIGDPSNREQKLPKAVAKLKEFPKPIVLNETSRKNLQLAWGRDMRKWSNRKVKATVSDQNVRGTMRKVLYLVPA